jgi:nitroreductase
MGQQIREQMDVLEAIRTRRSIGKVTGERPSREQIETILEAGAWAPCHHLTHPWRFVVIAGDERVPFGKVMAQSKLNRMEREGRSTEGEAERLVAKALRAPVIIAVAVEPSDAPKVVEIEEIESGAAAVQNMLLAAQALGLGTIWRTGDPAYDPDVARYLGLSDRSRVIGFVYVGYPAVGKERGRHVPFPELTTWRGWVD